ncbi:serine hydrolase domain-containing protein [Glacieibacterium sp.]|uniref:serine hydrolase domain-containing protein n=1 Tax=Glacieibacterium sp. TaxID=2860237 RepID=UPI003AFFEBCA
MTGNWRLAAALACVLIALPGAAEKPAPGTPAAAKVLPSPALPADTAAAASPVSGPPALTASDVGAWLDGYFPGTLQQGKIAGAQVVIVKDGKILFKKGYGYADVAAKTPMDPDRTLMRIGSTSKLLTWTAVMQQVEAGKIDLGADVNKYLDFKIVTKTARPVTMDDLMTHRGGFEEGLKNVLDTDPKRFKSTERFLKENGRPAMFPVGAMPAYSNYGAALAGYIVERVSGEPFESYIERHILTPLQMQHTTFVQPLPAALVPLMSKGYRQDDQPPVPYELVATAPAGSVAATGADMANFMIANLQDGRFGEGQILKPETSRLMHTPEVAPRPGFDTLAHGFFYGPRNGHLVLGHGGDTIVFHTDMNLVPDQNLGIFVSFNSRGERDAVYGARSRLFDLFMDRYFPVPPVKDAPLVAGAAAHAAALAGRYESSRRVEHGFISLFYLIQQEKVIDNGDGSISLASIEGKRFREIAPNLWREAGGVRELLVTGTGSDRQILDSTNPVGVLQPVSFARNADLNLWIGGLSVLLVLLTVLFWPVAAWLRRTRPAAPSVTGRAVTTRRLTRIAALADLVYLGGWYAIVAPILSNTLDAYNDGMDGVIRLMQIAAIVPIVAAIIGIWNAVTIARFGNGWGVKARAVIVAMALAGIVWIAAQGGLMSLDLNY